MSAEKPEPGDVWLHEETGEPSAWAAASKAAGRAEGSGDRLGIAEVLQDPNGLAGLSLAPWTDLQVAVLNAFQAEPNCHPFTCGTEGCRATLVAETNGWRCPLCYYRQGWCHNFMLDPSVTQSMREARETIGVDKFDDPSAWAAALRFAPLGLVAVNECYPNFPACICPSAPTDAVLEREDADVRP